MPRRAILLAAILALASGCGDSNSLTLTERGLKEYRSGQYDQAIATCTQAVEQDPRDAEAYLYRGRAYYFRNALGDPKRAIDDFSQVIRLLPRSSDAFYSRALVYRDLGQKDLAMADDKAARAADDQLQNVYNLLPDPTAPTRASRTDPKPAPDESTPAAQQASGEGLPKSEADQKELYEQLKERFEPGFGSLRSAGGARDRDADAKDSTLERYRHKLRTPSGVNPTLEERLDERGSLGGSDPSQAPPITRAGGLPAGANAANVAPGRAIPSSPFGPRVPAPVGAAPPQNPSLPVQSPFGRQLQTPFGQRTPTPSRFTDQSVGPFSAQPRPFDPVPYSNPEVRPPFPREYEP